MRSFTTKVKDGPQQMTMYSRTLPFLTRFSSGVLRELTKGDHWIHHCMQILFSWCLWHAVRGPSETDWRVCFFLGKKSQWSTHDERTHFEKDFFWLWMVFGWLSSKTQRQSRAPVFGIGGVWSSMNGTFWVDEIVTWPSTSINTTQWFEAPTPVDIEQDWQRFGIQFWSFFWTKHGWCLVARPEATWIYITYENLWFFLICSVYLLIISSFFAGFSHDSASIFVGDGLIQGAVMFGRTPGDIATASLTVLWRSCLRRQRDCWGS